MFSNPWIVLTLMAVGFAALAFAVEAVLTVIDGEDL